MLACMTSSMLTTQAASKAASLQASKQGVQMCRWTIGNLKGGTSKTTVAVLLAVALGYLTGERILLVDADPTNETAWTWRQVAGDSWPSNITVVRWQDDQLIQRLDESEGSFDHVVIDTGPHHARVLRMALNRTDTLVLPVAPTANEVVRIKPTLEEAAEVGAVKGSALSLAVLLTRTRQGTNSRVEVRRSLAAQDLPVMGVEIPLSEQIAQALGTAPTSEAELGPFLRAALELMEEN